MDRRTFLIAGALSSVGFATMPSLVSGTWAQRQTQMPLATARLCWDWVQGSGGVVEEFEIICGAVRKTIPDPTARSILVKDVVPGPGLYTGCTIVAKNCFGSTMSARIFPPFRVSPGRDVVSIL